MFNDGELLVATVGDFSHGKGWVIDSGTTHLICSHRAWFGKYVRCAGGKFMSMADGSYVPIM